MRRASPALLWLASALVASCAGAAPAPAPPDGAVTPGPADADTDADTDAGAGADVPADVDPAVARGAAVFRRYCAPCHGARGTGTGDGPDLRREVPASTDGEIARILRDGGRAMPVVPIDDAQRADVLAYVRATFGPYAGR